MTDVTLWLPSVVVLGALAALLGAEEHVLGLHELLHPVLGSLC